MDIGDAFKSFINSIFEQFVAFGKKFVGDLFTTSANILVKEFEDFGPELATWVHASLSAADSSGAEGLDKMKVALSTFRDQAGDTVADKSDTLLVSLLQNAVNVAKVDATAAVSGVVANTVAGTGE